MTNKVSYAGKRSALQRILKTCERIFRGLLLLGAVAALIQSVQAEERLARMYEPSAGVVVTDAGTVKIEWVYPPDQMAPVGWHLERLTPSGTIRITSEPVTAEVLSTGLPEYCAEDFLTGIVPGDHLIYRFVAVDFRAQEWPLPLIEYTVQAEPDTSLIKAPAESAPLIQITDDPAPESGSRVRMEIISNGLYSVSADTLTNYLSGFSFEQITNAIAQTNLALSCGGEPVAWMADANGTALAFYGQSFFDSYADRNVYWIDPGPGTNMTVLDGTTGVVESNQWFVDTLHVESNLLFSAMVPGTVDDDCWVWSYKQVTGSAVSSRWSTAISLPGKYPDQSSGEVSVKLIGFYLGQQHTCLVVNGVLLDDRLWDGNARLTQSGTPANLTNGAVSVAVDVLREPETATTFVIIDSIEVKYARSLTALDDQLLFSSGEGVSNLTVRGFSAPDICFLDVTDPMHPVRFLATEANEGVGGWRTTASVAASASNRYMASSRRLSPALINGVTPAGWQASSATGTPHLVIAPRALADAAAALVSYRTGQGLDSRLVEIEDLYDEFSWGRRDPHAINLFLKHATDTWLVPPRYVCLAGDGHVDYHDYYTQSATRPNHIPPLLARVLFAGGAYVTYATIGVDNPLADLDDDGITDIALGRLPARTAAGLTHMINRIITYEASSDWKNRVLFAADKDPDFDASCITLSRRIPSDLTSEFLFYGPLSTVTMQTNFAAGLNAGRPFFVYSGHCNSLQFGEIPFFKSANIPLLTNDLQTSVMLIAACQLNDFSFPTRNFKCLGAWFLDNGSAKGAPALWATASENYLYPAERTIDKMLEALFVARVTRLGDMVVPAMEVLGSLEGYSWIAGASVLLGDPGMLVAPRPSSYAVWRAQTFSPPESTNDAVSGPLADYNGSGTANLLHFVYGTVPGSMDIPEPVWTDRSTEEAYPRASFLCRRWLDGVSWHWESTGDLKTGVWHRVDQDLVITDRSWQNTDFDQIQIEFRQIPSNTVFLRLYWDLEP